MFVKVLISERFFRRQLNGKVGCWFTVLFSCRMCRVVKHILVVRSKSLLLLLLLLVYLTVVRDTTNAYDRFVV